MYNFEYLEKRFRIKISQRIKTFFKIKLFQKKIKILEIIGLKNN